MLTKSRWQIDEIDEKIAAEVAQSLNISMKLSVILQRRGFRTVSQAEKFLFPNGSSLHSPFLMKNMTAAVERLKAAVKKGEKIGIFSDSDLDGMTAMTVFHSMLDRMRIAPFVRFTKNSETYGLTMQIVDEFAQNGVNLIVTADSGTRDIDEIAYARSRGIDTIVTDHHEPDSSLPDAIIINPKQKDCPYPFKDLCGASVIFKFCQAFLFSYLPAFNASFALLAADNDGFEYMVIKNGMTEDHGRASGQNEILNRLQLPRDDLTLIHSFEDVSLTGLEDVLKSCRSVHYTSFFMNTRAKQSGHVSSDSSIAGMHSRLIETLLAPSEKTFDFTAMALGLTAIGIIADVMPLIEENRTLLKIGIDYLNRTKHPGILELKKKSMITSKAIAWEIAPLLNSPGRFGLTDLTGRFFLSSDPGEIRSAIDDIRRINEKRKRMVNDIFTREFGELGKRTRLMHRNFTCVTSPDIPDGIAGLIAVKISEKNDKPAIVISTGTSDGICKGSGRSAAGIDFFSAVEPLSGCFERIGGHAQAFGFTIKIDRIEQVMLEIDTRLDGIPKNNSTLKIDAEINIGEIDRNPAREIEMLAPFGKCNEEPVIISRNVTISGFSRFGEEGRHGRFILEENPEMRVIGWRLADEMERIFKSGKAVDIVYTMEEREFNGRKYVQLQVIDCAYSL